AARLAVLRFSWPRPYRASHFTIAAGNAHAPLVLFRPGQGPATQAGAQNRIRVFGCCPWPDALLCRPGRAAPQSEEAAAREHSSGHAVLAQESNPLRRYG